MIRRFSKLLRVAAILFVVALLSLSGELNILGLEIGSSVPTAKAAQIAIARPKLKFRDSDSQFLVVGENGGVPGILVENALGGATCYQSIIGTSASAIKSRLAFDAAGNVYVVWMEAPPNSGYQVFMAVLDANCNQVPGSPFAVSSLLSASYGISSAAGYPDIAYSPSENRVYLTFQGPGPNKQVLAFSGVAGTSGWNSGNRWDKVWGLPNAQAEAYPRIAVAPADVTGNVRAHIVFKSNNGSNGFLRAVDLSGGANGSWNQYTNAIGLDISNNPGNNVTDGSQEIGNSTDGVTYATYFSPGNGPLSVGMNKFDASTGGWGIGRDNVVGSSGNDYTKLVSSGLGVGHYQGVYIGLGVPSYVLTYTSPDKGVTFPANKHRNYGPTGGDTVAVTIAEGNNTVVVYSLDGVRTNHVYTFTGEEVLPHFSSVDAVLDANGYYAPRGTVDPNNVSSGLVYYPLPKPTRLLDTRPGQVAYSTPGTKIAAGGTATYPMAGINYTAVGVQIPSAAVAVVGSVTIVNPQGSGYLTMYPAGASKPLSASISYITNTILSNVATLTLGSGGQLSIYSLQSTDVVIDVSGYYAPAGTADPNNVSSGLLYYPLPKPTRLLDTRPGQAAYNAPGAKIPAGGTVSFPMAGINYTAVGVQIPSAAVALAGNTTAIFPTGGGYLTTYPTGTTQPLSASVSYGYNSILDTSVNLTLGSGANAGQLSIFSLQTTDIVIDVTGYYAPAGTADPNNVSSGLAYFPLPTPTRLLDTRAGQVAYNTPGTPLASNTSTNFKLANINYTAVGVQIPAAAQAIDSTITVVVPGRTIGEGYMTGYPGPADPSTNGKPLVTILYYYGGNILSNNSIQTVGSDGTLNIYAIAF